MKTIHQSTLSLTWVVKIPCEQRKVPRFFTFSVTVSDFKQVYSNFGDIYYHKTCIISSVFVKPFMFQLQSFFLHLTQSLFQHTSACMYKFRFRSVNLEKIKRYVSESAHRIEVIEVILNNFICCYDLNLNLTLSLY